MPAGAGKPEATGDGVPAVAATLNLPIAMAQAADGSIYIADYGNACIRKVNPAGIITTTTGCSAEPTVSGAIPPASPPGALTGGPTAIAVQPDGSFLFTDYYANRVRWVFTHPDGRLTVKTVAGSGAATVFTGFGTGGYDGDGDSAISARLNGPSGLTLTGGGGFAIADSENNRIRYVDPAGAIWTIAGSGPAGYLAGGYNGDGIPATSALLNRPLAISQQKDGSILIADQLNRRIRRLATTPPTNTVAPSVTGSTSIPSSLNCNAGTWTGNPALSYQWLQDGAPIPTATGPFFITSNANSGATLKCQVTGSTAGGSTVARSEGIRIEKLVDLTVNIPTGQGGVTILDTATQTHSATCPPSCVSQWSKGTTVTLYAFARTGYSLKDWTGDCDPESLPYCTVTVKQAQTVTANFVPQPTLNVEISGQGSVSDDDGDSCTGSTACAIKLDYGVARLLQATPATGQQLSQWTGCDFVADDGRCAVVMSANKTARATFAPLGTGAAARSAPQPAPNEVPNAVANVAARANTANVRFHVWGVGTVRWGSSVLGASTPGSSHSGHCTSPVGASSNTRTVCEVRFEVSSLSRDLVVIPEGAPNGSPLGPTRVDFLGIQRPGTSPGYCTSFYCAIDLRRDETYVVLAKFVAAPQLLVHVESRQLRRSARARLLLVLATSLRRSGAAARPRKMNAGEPSIAARASGPSRPKV